MRNPRRYRWLILFGFVLAIHLLGLGDGLAAEKVRYGTSIKFFPKFYLPPLAAEKTGAWKNLGLDVQWVAFRGGAAHFAAVAAKKIDTGAAASIDQVHSGSRGVPIIAVAQLAEGKSDFRLWVRGDSRYKKPADFRGAKIGVTRAGGAEYAFGQVLLKALGLSKDVKMVGTGSTAASMAALKAGSVNGLVLTMFRVANLREKGEVRQLASVDDYLPDPWLPWVVYARKDFAAAKPSAVTRIIKGILSSARYIKDHPDWAKARMIEMQRYSPAVADFLYPHLRFSTSGRIEKKGLENVRTFAIKFGLVPATAPPIEQMYTNRYLP